LLVSCRWLKDYVNYDISEEALADRLTMVGAAVETIEYLGQGLDNIVTGRVLTVEAHPNADSIRVCTVDIGKETLNIVCGAPNVAPGQIVPVALPGANLPNGMVIEEIELRGVLSQGMICSEAEVHLGDDADGIIVLPEDLPLGEEITKLLPYRDTVLEVEVYPNRPDLLSMIGIAREVAAITDGELKMPQPQVEEKGRGIEEYIEISVEDPQLCPRYSARLLMNCEIGPSPLWMQRRLIAAGMRPLNNVVDITNYVMLETGQPLHAFDYDRLQGGRLIIRPARAGEKIVTLDGVERELHTDDIVIADGQEPVCIGGVMGGENSEVGPNTRNILLESANFNPVSIRRTSRRLGLRSEASGRFEKGLDPNGTLLALNRAAELLTQLAGCEVAPGIIDLYPEKREPIVISLRPERVNVQLGTDLSGEQMAELLEKLELKVSRDGDQLQVEAPTYRGDLEGEWDLAEEIARLYGYDRIEPTLLTGRTTLGGQTSQGQVIDDLRDWLVGQGLMEILTYSFINPKELDRLMLPAESPMRDALALRNPLTTDLSMMRTTLLPGLIKVVSHNVKHGATDLALFEIGSIFLPRGDEEQPEERTTCGLAVMGRTFQRSWGDQGRPFDFYDLKGLLEGIWELFGAPWQLVAGDHPSLHPGRQAALEVGGEKVAIFGEIHPRVADQWELDERILLAEINVAALAALEIPPVSYVQLPRYPGIRRDLALLVPEEVPAGDILPILREIGGTLVRDVVLFDVYKGKQVPEGYKSLAYTITFQGQDRTLTDGEVNTVIEKIAAVLKDRLSITLRS
jgi:phenylalanyl-tRNA synthetase beta chain